MGSPSLPPVDDDDAMLTALTEAEAALAHDDVPVGAVCVAATGRGYLAASARHPVTSM